MKSIRRQLLIWQISALVLTGLLVSALTYGLAWNAFNRLRDDRLEQIAYSILRHGVESETGKEDADADDKGQFVSQIWDEKDKLVYSSITYAGPPPQANGNHKVDWRGEEWNVYTLRSGGLTIQVGNPSYNRLTRFAHIAPWLLLPFTVLVSVLGGLIWASVGQALTPLNRVREEIGRRDIASLHALDIQPLPDEIAPLVEAINALLARLDDAIVSQRRFVADAAHELRTPLTAIRLQAQLAGQAASNETQRNELKSLLQGIERAGRLVDQLLRMARLEAAEQQAVLTTVRLDELAKQVVVALSSRADASQIDLGITDFDVVSVTGHFDGLYIMLENLVDNALRYTPAKGTIDVAVTRMGNQAVLQVSDTGPGIPISERESVFDRFHRLAGADIPGSGLGLAIVRQVVDAHNGVVVLADAPGGGLCVRVTLPKPNA